LPFPVSTKNLGGEIKQVAHFVPVNFYKFETHKMANFNIPPPDQTNIQEISPPVKFFFQGKKKGAPGGL
jgi:hypothetical protein